VAAALVIAAVTGKPRITKIEFRPATVEEEAIVISLAGTGCTPRSTSVTGKANGGRPNCRTACVTYEAGKAFDVVATADAPCEGVARARIDVRGIDRGIWRVLAELASATAPEIVVTVDGRGACTVLLDFGDGQSEKHELMLPAKVPHKYAKNGAYEIHARTQDPCRGEGRVRIEIKSGQ
jgi:hypothetical protein